MTTARIVLLIVCAIVVAGCSPAQWRMNDWQSRLASAETTLRIAAKDTNAHAEIMETDMREWVNVTATMQNWPDVDLADTRQGITRRINALRSASAHVNDVADDIAIMRADMAEGKWTW